MTSARTIRHIVDLHLFDEAIDDNDPQDAAIVQLLRRHRDPYEDIAGARVGLFQRIGEFIDLGDGDTLSLDGGNERACLTVELGESPSIVTRPTIKLKRSDPAGACNGGPADGGSSLGALGAAGRSVWGVTWLGATWIGATWGKGGERTSDEGDNAERERAA